MQNAYQGFELFQSTPREGGDTTLNALQSLYE